MKGLISVAMCMATLLFSGVEVSAQRESSSSRSSSTVSSGRGSEGSSSSRDNVTKRGESTANRGSSSSSSHSQVSARPAETRPSLQPRGSVQTGTNNKHLKPTYVSPSENYKSLPERGKKVSKFKATSGAHYVKFSGVDYYYKKGVFYSYDHLHKHYVVSRPPLGVRVNIIPQARVIFLNNVNYYYYYGTFYRRVAAEYEVVAPPVGAIVESIPDGYEQLMVNGNTYYIVDGIQYKAVVYHGEIWYEVIKILD